MKINSPNITEPQLTVIGQPYDEGFAEQLDPKTGMDLGDILPGSIELMPINMPNRDGGTTHEGDMGRLGKSE
jgi:hypothetical protein